MMVSRRPQGRASAGTALGLRGVHSPDGQGDRLRGVQVEDAALVNHGTNVFPQGGVGSKHVLLDHGFEVRHVVDLNGPRDDRQPLLAFPFDEAPGRRRGQLDDLLVVGLLRGIGVLVDVHNLALRVAPEVPEHVLGHNERVAQGSLVPREGALGQRLEVALQHVALPTGLHEEAVVLGQVGRLDEHAVVEQSGQEAPRRVEQRGTQPQAASKA
mmetsp:Transcript_16464/g.62592  ORF Transcript_16464/g.62592 Transcript_16464/m.62592 type:complete len:213 (+) Transcript_16464:853-1491(+)